MHFADLVRAPNNIVSEYSVLDEAYFEMLREMSDPDIFDAACYYLSAYGRHGRFLFIDKKNKYQVMLLMHQFLFTYEMCLKIVQDISKNWNESNDVPIPNLN